MKKWIEKVTLAIEWMRPSYPPPTYPSPEGTYRYPKPHYTGVLGMLIQTYSPPSTGVV